ncbi:Calx-beta domain-containing protein [Nevskia sp.]|uniref:Calx-beta domain-containing protein n=1 Tax=Nevskia sp. TaxID=1929292 RepID=UPI0025DC22D0|nr:Calx-beta domain-containing protein [Nevskia sp.]
MKRYRFWQALLACVVPLGAALAINTSVPTHARKGQASSDPTGVEANAAPTMATISGTPLTIRIGSDTSFQILNADNPGIGQIFPSDSSGPADMGWFVDDGTTLYAPRFNEHVDGSATNSLGTYTGYTPVSISPVSGSGTTTDPYLVTTVNDLGDSGMRETMRVSYVNGQNYFTKLLTVANNGTASQTVRIFLAADIYLANSDSGIPYREPNSGSPGGSDCGETPLYFILLIPQTPADAFSATAYSNVWSQIGNAALDSAINTGCQDNGAGLQWNRTIPAGSNVSIQAVTSFGTIPSIAQFNVTQVAADSGQAGQAVNVTITGIGFQAGTTFGFGAGISVGNLVIVSPTTATASLSIAADAAVGARDVTAVQGNGQGSPTATLSHGYTVIAAPVSAGSAQLSAASYTVDENGGSLSLSVTRSGGSAGTCSLSLRTSDGSARAGSDYAAVDVSVVFADGDTAAKTVSLPISDDTAVEGNETLSVGLFLGETTCTLGAPATATVTIVDNDQEVVPPPPPPPNPSPTGGQLRGHSGGAGSPALLLLLSVAGWLRRRRGLRSGLAIVAGTTGLAIVAAALPLPAVADSTTGWFAGGRIGASFSTRRNEDFSRELSAEGHVATVDVEHQTTGFSFYGGYQFSQALGLEISYYDLGRFHIGIDSNEADQQRLADDAVKLAPRSGRGAAAAWHGVLLLFPGLALETRLGAAYLAEKRTLHNADGTVLAIDREHLPALTGGLGLSLNLASNLTLGFGSQFYDPIGQGAVTQVYGQLEFQFGR